MKKFNIRISASAEKSIKKIPRKDQSRIIKAILELADNPMPAGTRKLAGYNDIFRIRAGRYRIIYSVEEKIITVIILKIGHRKEVYRHY